MREFDLLTPCPSCARHAVAKPGHHVCEECEAGGVSERDARRLALGLEPVVGPFPRPVQGAGVEVCRPAWL